MAEIETKTQSQLKSALTFFWDLLKIFVLAFLIIAPFRLFVAEPFVVSGSSMVPNYHNRDYLIIDRITYKNREPKRGEVIVLKYPKDTRQYFIKRIIGLPGEKVKIENGFVYIFNAQNPQGLKLNEPYLVSATETLGKMEPYVLGEDQYLVLGDNRTASSDSRVWGILPKDDIVGKIWVRVLPLKDFGKMPTPKY